jgi:phage host-nuclease inhibitor protein Gam
MGIRDKLKRVRLVGPKLVSWEQVDQHLLELGRLDMQIEGVEARLTEVCNQAKEKASAEGRPLIQRREQLEREVKEFVEASADQMAPARSLVLQFGTVGLRKAKRLHIKKTVDTVRRLRELGMLQYLRIKEEPDKEALRELGDEILEKVGITRKEEDAFFLEVNREKVRAAG